MNTNNLKRISVILSLACFTLIPRANAITEGSFTEFNEIGNNKDKDKEKDNNGNGGGTDNNNGQYNDNSGYTQTNGNSTNNIGAGRNNDSIPLDGGISIFS